ncbi:hypothetical protein NQ314_006125 [Rhamnusium bicolor]|uniref:Vacuolar protein sorting-associated protein 13A n=1 Tax=Rhamnusium bicolor TaxID=1586634 RepID=A0AAV8Z782_9CUCU|nr:hypothetical protein NQ314_006125 [Rhamnusium bicolor]
MEQESTAFRMLEGAVARLLNQLLGKYVVDLDTENLNVGIFSGHVQLTDLKLKPEALYELNLPIEVKVGTIGKVWLQIPWASLWKQPIIVNIEDLHIVVGPIVTNEPFDEEKNKRLTRAAKRKLLADLDTESQILGGPSSFSEHLISNILNYLQLNITNVHVRYEDSESCKTPLAGGLCIGTITAETTNSKWKPTRYDSHSDTCHYLVKIEAFSMYWNPNVEPKIWELPSQYYQWRNAIWQFLSIRPTDKIVENQKIWWRYASYALLEQRVKPYTWSRIRRMRQYYKDYMETYKQIILNPNDTELKLDLQKYEDKLSIINPSIEEVETYLTTENNPTKNLLNYFKDVPTNICSIMKKKLSEKWDFNLNIKIPYIVIPEASSYLKINIIQEDRNPKLYIKDRIKGKFTSKFLRKMQDRITIADSYSKYKRYKTENGKIRRIKKDKSIRKNHHEDMNEAWARCVDLPGLEDNISPNNNINILFGFVINEVSANCPDFWTHFHGVETSNVLHKKSDTPVPPGSVKFSHSARLTDINVTVCDSDFDIVNVQLSGLEMDFLFRANERFVFRSFLSNINIEHLSDVTLYSKVLHTDEDKVFDIKYVRNATHVSHNNDISPNMDETFVDGSFKFQLGRINCTFLYKLIVQLQETLIEPISLNMDIKRYTNSKTSQRSWDIDSIIDSIKVTLGQRDLTTIMSIYTDNIGEGKILDLFPNQIKSPTDLIESDETVRSLEAFFCEPKQKNIVAKCTIDEVQLMLFFDSGELLSSPIRDLNHGLCKMEILEIDTSFVVYNDKSLDGKLSIDTIRIEEIGPDANAYDKIILQSPVDDNKNNNCNITVNKPPIVDITFHQNKTGDKSADVIIGRLSLSLSIPFCEKLALFVIECLPKDHLDVGIINPGYEAEVCHTVAQKVYSTSLTLSIRINRPELMFLVETTSNKKRYFITKSEILIDYSRHANRLNVVMSLSGLHSLFYDLGEYSEDPYIILKQCDVELCKSFSEESGEKITMAISSIYVKLCSEVVHSINDILNDIVEHFKVPEVETVRKERRKSVKTPEAEDLWEPKKLIEFVEKCESLEDAKTDNTIVVHEILLVPKFDVVVIFELEQTQVFLVKSTVELTLYDWSSLLNCTCELTIQANYFNENVQSWEPVIDPIVIDEKEYKPWEVIIKIFQDKSMPMLDTTEHKTKIETNKRKKCSRSVTTTEDEDSGEDMMYLEPINAISNGNNRRVKTSLSTFLDDSDSENEDGTMEKLAAAISDLFTGDWNENEDSDCDHSSEGEDDMEENEKPKEEHDMIFNKSFYILLDAKETFNVTVTPNILKVINELLTQYSNKIISVRTNKKSISLINDIGPQTRVELYEKNGNSDDNRLLCIKKYENEDSAPNSPSKSLYFVPDYLDNNFDDRDSCTDDDKDEFEITYDFETMSSLQFPAETTAQLYDKINKNFMKIFVPNFLPIQSNCSKRNWEKLIRLHSVNPTQTYYLAARHNIGKLGRNVVISSPLQIKNETCFALSVLYQPSILQQLNLEPVGDITNPFETTMRIAVLEAHEEYNVPLYIAYHCKLFIQPAYVDKIQDHFINGAPEGSIGLASKSGWIDADLFLDVLKYIQKNTRCIKDFPVFLIMDNHESHISINAINCARDNGIGFLLLHPHTSHKMQPLDVRVFGPFKGKCKIAFNDWHLNHPRRSVTIYDIPSQTKTAFFESFTLKNITSAFVTDRENSINDNVCHKDPSSTNNLSAPTSLIPQSESPCNISSTLNIVEKSAEGAPAITSNPENLDSSLHRTSSTIILPENIRPFPRADKRKRSNKGRQPGKSRIHTDTPEKETINQIAIAKRENAAKLMFKKSKTAIKELSN